MTIAHDIRGHLHAARLHMTFVARALAKPGSDPELSKSAIAAGDELRQLERLVLELLAVPSPPPEAPTT